MTVYQVICWFKNIKPSERSSNNLSGGAVFSSEEAAAEFTRRVRWQGGEVLDIRRIENGHGWFESLEEYDRAGLMTSGELHAIGQRQ